MDKNSNSRIILPLMDTPTRGSIQISSEATPPRSVSSNHFSPSPNSFTIPPTLLTGQRIREVGYKEGLRAEDLAAIDEHPAVALEQSLLNRRISLSIYETNLIQQLKRCQFPGRDDASSTISYASSSQMENLTGIEKKLWTWNDESNLLSSYLNWRTAIEGYDNTKTSLNDSISPFQNADGTECLISQYGVRSGYPLIKGKGEHLKDFGFIFKDDLKKQHSFQVHRITAWSNAFYPDSNLKMTASHLCCEKRCFRSSHIIWENSSDNTKRKVCQKSCACESTCFTDPKNATHQPPCILKYLKSCKKNHPNAY